MYARRAFVSHFVGEMEEGALSEGREDMAALVNEYESEEYW